MKHNTKKTFHLTQELTEQCRTTFEADTRIREMTKHAQRLQANGRYTEAMAILKQKELLFDKVLVAYEQQIESQVTEVQLSAANLPPEDIQEIERLIVTLFMAIDIMDSCLLDINDTLHRTDKGLSFEHLDDLHEMAHMCREQLSQFSEKEDYHKYAHWGEITDNMYTVMQNKAKAIIRKTAGKKAQKK